MIVAVADGGALVTPHVVKAVDLGEGWADLRVPAPRTLFTIPQDVLEPVRDGLWLAVNGVGTATRARIRWLRRVGQDRHGAGHFG